MQARADGAEAAAVEWQERERQLQDRIANLEAQLGKAKVIMIPNKRHYTDAPSACLHTAQHQSNQGGVMF